MHATARFRDPDGASHAIVGAHAMLPIDHASDTWRAEIELTLTEVGALLDAVDVEWTPAKAAAA